ncbi:MAG TPA: hypothetical protein VFX59_27240 [Polyangiales bacterium]|nr:hypothetical protein [Polyangiales bacterium]
MAIIISSGCGDDDERDGPPADSGSADAAMLDAARGEDAKTPPPIDSGVGVVDAAGIDAGPQQVAKRWIAGGWLTTDDSYTGFLTVVKDLSAAGSIDLSQVVEIPDDMTHTVSDQGVVYVGINDKPTIERWVLGSDDKLTKDGEVSLRTRGITSTLGGGRNVIQLVDAERAYYFDNENLQVIVFHPLRMEILTAFSLAGMEAEGQEHALNFIHRDGNRFILTARYWSLADESSSPLVRAAIVDSTNDSVTYVDDTRCGNVAFNVTDSAGNLYLGSHPGLAVSIAAGTAGPNPPKPCILRINKGQSTFDPSYFVELGQLASGGVVGGLLQGIDGNAYVFQYTGSGITADNERATLRGEDWALARIKLGDERSTFARANGIGAVTPYGSSFSTNVNGKIVPFIIGVKADFSAGRYYDASDALNLKEALSFPGFPGHAHAVY